MAHERRNENESQPVSLSLMDQEDAAAVPLPADSSELFGVDLGASFLGDLDFACDLDFDFGRWLHDLGDGDSNNPKHNTTTETQGCEEHPATSCFEETNLSSTLAAHGFQHQHNANPVEVADFPSIAAGQLDQRPPPALADPASTSATQEMDDVAEWRVSSALVEGHAVDNCVDLTEWQLPGSRPSLGEEAPDGAHNPPASASKLRTLMGKAISVVRGDHVSISSGSAGRSKKRRRKRRPRPGSSGSGVRNSLSLSGSTRVSSSHKRKGLGSRESLVSRASSIQTWISHTAEHTGTSFYPGFHEQLNALIKDLAPGAFVTPLLSHERRSHVHAVANFNMVGHMSVGEGANKRIILSRFKMFAFSGKGTQSRLPLPRFSPGLRMNPQCVVIRSFSKEVINGLLASNNLQGPSNFTDLTQSAGVENNFFMLSYLSPADAADVIGTLSKLIRQQCVGFALYQSGSSRCVGGTMDPEYSLEAPPASDAVGANPGVSLWTMSAGNVEERPVSPVRRVAPLFQHEVYQPLVDCGPRRRPSDSDGALSQPVKKPPPPTVRSPRESTQLPNLFPLTGSIWEHQELPSRSKVTPKTRKRSSGYVPPPTSMQLRYPNGIGSTTSLHRRSSGRSSLRGADSSASNRTSEQGSMYSVGSNVSRKRKRQPRIEKGYECDAQGCGACFDLSSELDKHTKNAHAPPAERPYPCDQCDMAFLYPKDLRRHMRKKHPHQWALQAVRNMIPTNLK